jgi:hypothetical protein
MTAGGRKANAWNTLVSKIYQENKHKNGYKLKNAMMDAKKVYKPHSFNGVSADKFVSMGKSRKRGKSIGGKTKKSKRKSRGKR